MSRSVKFPVRAFFVIVLLQLMLPLCNIDHKIFAQNNIFRIFVKDSLRNLPLEGTTLKIITKGDTIISVSDKNGVCKFVETPGSEYTIIASYVGYKTKILSVYPNQILRSIDISLTEDVKELRELIIKDQAVMVVISGDTLVYNISALKTIEGDDLIESISLIPGISINEGSIFHFGRPVSRIYVNKTLLFGKDNLKAPLTNLKSDEVQKVEIYEESTDYSKFLGVNNGDKQKVMNIVTKKHLDVVTNISLNPAVGKEKDNKELKYNISGSFNKYSLDRIVESNLNFANINSGILLDRVRNKSKTLLLNYIEKSIPKIEISAGFVLDYKANENNTDLYRTYLYPQIDILRLLRDTSKRNEVNNRSIAKVKADYIIDTSNIVSLEINFNKYIVNLFQKRTGFINDNSLLSSRYQNFYEDYNSNYTFSPSFIWMHRFRKPGRSLIMKIVYNHGIAWGAGNQGDTNSQSTIRNYVTKRMDGNNTSAVGNISYSEPLFKGVFSLSYEFSNRNGLYKRNSFDQFLAIIDTTNTSDLSTNNLINKISASYGKSFEKMRMSGEIGFLSNNYLRDERFPEIFSNKRSFSGIQSRIGINKELAARQSVEFSYNSYSIFPSIEELRSVVLNSNPLFLSSGNPDLKSSYHQMSEIKYTYYTNKGSIFIAQLSGSNTINGLATRKEYFTDDTYIEKYHYTFPKGSTLSSSVNVDGIWGSKFILSYSMNIPKINSILSVAAGHEFQNTPFFLNEEHYNQTNNKFNLDINYKSNFSRKFNFSIFSYFKTGIISIRNFNSFNYFNELLILDARIVILKKVDIRSSYNFYYYINPEIKGSRTDYGVWNLSVTGNVLKGKAKISLIVKDILNDRSGTLVSVNEDYFQTTYNSDIFKRSLLVSMSYNLNYRK